MSVASSSSTPPPMQSPFTAAMIGFLYVSVSGGALGRRGVVDAGLPFACAVPAQTLRAGRFGLVGCVPAEMAQRRAQRGAMLHREPIGRDLRPAAAEAAQRDAPAPAERRQRR